MKNQEYIYNFKSGGWNSEYASSIEEAISQAKKRWSDPDDVDENSFRIQTDIEEKLLLSNFY
jgi:hypothetical protein